MNITDILLVQPLTKLFLSAILRHESRPPCSPTSPEIPMKSLVNAFPITIRLVAILIAIVTWLMMRWFQIDYPDHRLFIQTTVALAGLFSMSACVALLPRPQEGWGFGLVMSGAFTLLGGVIWSAAS